MTGFKTVDQLTELQIERLHDLMSQQWWGGTRTLTEVRQMVANTSLMVGLVESSSSELVGYCRALTDFVFRATIYDVMVRPDLQGQGLGGRLVDTLCRHPRLTQVSLIYLACEPELFQFYEKWGFRQYEGRAHWMVKVQTPEE